MYCKRRSSKGEEGRYLRGGGGGKAVTTVSLPRKWRQDEGEKFDTHIILPGAK
jgi:hypothetical protein